MTIACDYLQDCHDRLDELCRDRPLRTSEIHRSNDYYGQASVLKRYAGLPRWYSLKAVLEHSLVLYDRMSEEERHELLPIVFARSTGRARFLEHQTGKRVIPIGFTSLYAQRLLKRRPNDTRRTGTIVFPYKSGPTKVDTHFDHADYAERLQSLPARMHPVSVCFYWRDYLRGTAEAYRQRGLRVISAGHFYDPDFYLRLCAMCSQCEYAASNEFGTNLFVAVASGCKFFYAESSAIRRTVLGGDAKYERPECPGYNRLRERSRSLFAQPGETITADQQAFVDEVMGTEHFMPPQALRRLFWEAEVQDKLGAWRLDPGSREICSRWLPLASRSIRWVRSRLNTAKNSVNKRLGRGKSEMPKAA
jgi:hypothetical protein